MTQPYQATASSSAVMVGRLTVRKVCIRLDAAVASSTVKTQSLFRVLPQAASAVVMMQAGRGR